VRKRVSGPVQIATDNLRAYPFHIRSHFGYEGYSYGTETKVFGEPKLPDGTLARLGRNEGVRRMQTAERAARLTRLLFIPDFQACHLFSNEKLLRQMFRQNLPRRWLWMRRKQQTRGEWRWIHHPFEERR
jgi:hypothetical protein